MPENTSTGALFLANTFSIQIDGITLESLKSVSGLSLDVEVVTSESVVDSSGSHFTTKVPGKKNVPSITIVRGLNKNKALTDWIAKSRSETVTEAKKNVTITFQDTEKKEKRTATLGGVWVSRWSVGDLGASQSSEVDETVVLECDTIEFK
ncbi:phage tail protein [Streptomyces lavendulae]|uniref:phage tail protein n=1 Tax=Streptomyces lavendulae TaxID=1914 RepID=UPI0033CFF5E1